MRLGSSWAISWNITRDVLTLGNQCRGCCLMSWSTESHVTGDQFSQWTAQQTFNPWQLLQVPLIVGDTAHHWSSLIRLDHVTWVYLHPPMTSFVSYLGCPMCCLGMRWFWSSLPHGLIKPHNKLLTSCDVSVYTIWYFGVLGSCTTSTCQWFLVLKWLGFPQV